MFITLKNATKKYGEGESLVYALDHLNLEEIVGTIAGDDTIFMAARSEDCAKRLRDKIETLVVK